MNRLTIALALAAGAMFPALAQEKPAGSTIQGTDPEALKLVTDCNARKFETVVERDENGEKKSSKVKLCGKQGQTDAEWAATLKDAAAKIEANEKMPQTAKDQLTSALRAEIAKVEAGAVALPAPVASVEQPAPQPAPPPVIVAAKTPAVAPVVKKPKLTIRCLAPGEKGTGSSCATLDRATRLSIIADADLGGEASLRFLRRGDERAKLALAPMRQGETYRSKLPPELCAGVASTKVEIQVMGSGQVVETLGPYSLRC
ncbi:hypothetical protein LZ496_13125 [Sphingomonas sp. NSE70-1]|uniref:YARHG domain-containing protein n=1 Tax=Sphingomonas caseinilyticus TaxID=2908205 RepID=A0ABT0RYC6_9SPHN|nr:hypothetical protein [Sphingomonas caseinilyticus]MCL6699720.1 hypothetical protein [Sphingomonas caseinilyticus]